MMKPTLLNALRTGTAAIALLALQQSLVAQAQDDAPPATTEDGEFLGTLTLGESKREVQTDTATPVTVVDQEEIEDRQANTIAELIDSVPGVTLVNGGTPIGSGINIRGFGANGTYGTDQKVAILVDNASVGSEELYRIGTQLFTDPSLYKSVEVIRGTVGSFEYGSGIVGGVVRLETIDASALTGDEPGFAFRQSLGGSTNSNGFNSSSTAAWQPTENLEFLANYSWREQGNQVDGQGNTIENSEFELPSILLKAKYSAGDHSLTASFTDTETSERDKPYDSFGTTGGSFGNVDRDTKSNTATLGYNYNPASDLVDLDVILSYANQEITQECIVGSGPFGCFATVDADHRYETTKLTAKNSAFIATGSITHELRTGVEIINKERLTANSAPGGDDNRLAVFVVDQIGFGNGFTFTPALRWETSELDPDPALGLTETYEEDGLMGGASLRYEFDNGFAVFGSYAHTEALPILDDLQSAVFREQSEIADTVEFGASYDKIGVFTEQDFVSLKGNFYKTELTDVTSYSGVSEVEIQGLELEASYARRSGFYVDFNANFMDAERTQTSGAQSDWTNFPANNARITFGKRFDSLLDLSSEFVLADKAERDGTEQEPGYLVANLRATVTPEGGVLEGLSLRFSVENLFDHTYTPYLSTRYAPGRNLKFAITKAF
tara:strand:- start:354 stop:2360 length:2007 start_codon:yes stop_codon:yes gene_type:complete